MAYKVKNDTSRKIGVATPGGIFTVASGKSREFDDVMNLNALKAHEGVTVSGEKTDADAAGADSNVALKKATETAVKPATAPQAPKAG